jgi:hypothetical protein
VRVNKRTVFSGLLIAALVGPFLFMPAVSFVGSMLVPSQAVPATVHAPSLLAEAIWARANGGRATQLQPLNPFTVGRAASCHLLAERFEDQAKRDAEHNACMALLPGIEGIGYLSSVHLRSQGVWNDARVPFASLAQINKVMSTWTRTQVIDTLAERGEFVLGFQGTDQAARGFFNRSAAELTLSQAALIGSLLGDTRSDPWCTPARAAQRRGQILERMRDNGVIDDAAFDAANRSDLGLVTRPSAAKACESQRAGS